MSTDPLELGTALSRELKAAYECEGNSYSIQETFEKDKYSVGPYGGGSVLRGSPPAVTDIFHCSKGPIPHCSIDGVEGRHAYRGC